MSAAAGAREIDLHLRRWIDGLEREGLIVRCNVQQELNQDATRFSFILPNGRDYHAVLRRDELRMHERNAFDFVRGWSGYIEEAIRQHHRPRHAYLVPEDAEPLERGPLLEVRPLDAAAYRVDTLYGWAAVYPTVVGIDFAQDEKAERRAADLFRLVAGQATFDTLNAGQPVPLTGSKGTKYELRKQASFCVTRVKDGAKLCAVVPGVPLWDHLLGIKLMVEHDEPKFLRIANVAGGAAHATNHPATISEITAEAWRYLTERLG